MGLLTLVVALFSSGGLAWVDALSLPPAPVLRILGEGDQWVAVEKPSGVSMHGPRSILNLLRDQESTDAQYRLVHRLDDGTSGVMVIAKGRIGAKTLSEAFYHRRVVKAYVGLSASIPSKKKSVIRGNMIRSRRSTWKIERKCTQGQSCACTEMMFRGLGEVSKSTVARRLLIAKPFTGRTHQIRVAAKCMGAPLLGDIAYGGKAADRLYLHAAALRIQIPDDRDIHIISKPTFGNEFISSRFNSIWSSLDWNSFLSTPPSPICCNHPALSPPPVSSTSAE